MWQRNNGQAREELQIRFTGYLIQAVKRTRRDYLNMLNQYSNSEILTDTTYTTGQTLEQEVTEHLPLWDVIESNALFYALKRLNERERYVFLSHVLDNCPFDLIGVRLGLTYKGAAAVYYRAVQKLRKSIEGVENMIFEQLLFQAKEGDLESITDILNMYRPLLLKYSVIDGRLDEDLYQEQCITLMRAIKLFRI